MKDELFVAEMYSAEKLIEAPKDFDVDETIEEDRRSFYIVLAWGCGLGFIAGATTAYLILG